MLRDLARRCIALAGALPVAALLSAAAPGPSLAAPAAASVSFLAHQAAYELSLLKTRRNESVDGVQGRILYSFSGTSCEGYTTDFRQVSQISGSEGRATLSDLRSTSWEDGEGKSYRFRIETRTNDASINAVDGTAERTGEHIAVKLKLPTQKTFTLDRSVVFPTEQVHRIIEAARAGRSILELSVYDGSENGEKVFSTLSVIGQPIPGDRPPASPDSGSDSAALKAMTRWPVTVSYYDRSVKSETGEQTPIYAMSFELYENGVSRQLKLDYNDFVIAGAMTRFDVRADGGKPCN